MTLPDVGPLGSLAGWFLAVFVMASVVTLMVLGKLVAGPTHDRALRQIDERDKLLAEQTPLLREQGKLLAEQGNHIEFMVQFVRDVLRERMRPDG